MGKLKDEVLKLDIVVNGNAGQKALGDLEQANRKLKNTNDDLRKSKQLLKAEGKQGSDQWKKLTAEISSNNVKINENKTKMAGLRKQIGLTALTTKQLSTEQSRLKTILANTTPNTAAYSKYNAQLQKVNSRLKELRLNSQSTGNSINKMAGGIGRFLGAFGIGVGILGAINGIKKLNSANVELEESQANVMKVTGYTKNQVNGLTKELKKLNTRTAINELLGLAEAGGRLELKGQDLLDYVKNTDEAFVALGDSLEGSAADIGLTLGKIAGQFNLEEKYGIGKSIGKIGSSLNELGANSKATEGPIVDFIKRLAGVSNQANISAPDIAALGALFDENGQSIEVASTTFNKLLPAIGKNVEKFAKIAGMNVKDFKEVVENDAFEALKLIAKGAQSNQKGLLGLTETLQNYGISNARAASIVGILSSKTDRLTELQKISNDAFEDGISLSQEFSIKNTTLGAIWEKIGNTLAAKFTGGGVNKFLKGIASGFYDIIKPSNLVSKSLEKQRINLFVLESKIKDVNTSNEDRIKLINQLKGTYPNLLSNIDAEKVSNENLSKAIKLVNDELINKIILEEKDEEVLKQVNKIASAKLGFLEAETRARKYLADAVANEGIQIKEGVGLTEQLADAYKQLNKGKSITQKNRTLKVALDQLNWSQKNLNEVTEEGNKLEKKRNALAKQLNITIGSKNKNSPENTPKKGDKKMLGGVPVIFNGTSWEAETINTQKAVNSLNVLNEELSKLTKKQSSISKEDAKALQPLIDKKKAEIEDFKRYINESRIGMLDSIDIVAKQRIKTATANITNEQELQETILAINLKATQDKIKLFTKMKGKKQELNAGDLAMLQKLSEQEFTLQEEINTNKLTQKANFEQRKRELQNEIDLQNAETDAEKELLTATQNLEKDLLEIESLRITETQKGELKKAIVEKYIKTIDNITDKATLKRLKAQAAADIKEINFEKQKSTIKIDLAQQLGNSLLSILGNTLSGRIAAIAFDAIIEIAKLKIATSAAQQINMAQAVASAPPPLNAAFMAAAKIQNVVLGVSSKKQQGLILASSAIGALGAVLNNKKGYEDGYYPVTRTDGKQFNSKLSNSSHTQMVTQPTYFSDGNYLAGEGGPEIIIDTPTLKNLDPSVIKNIYATAARTRGYESGYYKNSETSTEPIEINSFDFQYLTQVLETIAIRLNEPLTTGPINIGDNEIDKLKKRGNKLDQTRTNAKIS